MHMNALGALVLSGLGSGGETQPAEEPEPSLLKIQLSEDVTVKVFGRVFFDIGWFSGDEATFNTDTSGATPELEDGTEFRTARLGAEGTLFEKVGYKAEFDLAGGRDAANSSGSSVNGSVVDLKDVYMYLKDVLGGEVRAGHYKEPFGLEQLTSSRFITFMERSVMSAFAPDRNSGISYLGHNGSKTMTWSAGAFRTTEDSGFDVGDSEYSYTGRVTGTPWYRDDGTSLLHLGGAVTYRMDDEVRFRSRPEANLVNRVADTGAIAADDTAILGLESALVLGPFSAQAEYNLASVSASGGGSDGDFSGFYAFLSVFLTGEHRNYKTSSATFDRVKPDENLGSGPGAIELAARFSMLDLDDGPISDELMDATIGVNWYLNPNSRIMLNVVHAEFEDGTVDDSMDALMMRFQVDW